MMNMLPHFGIILTLSPSCIIFYFLLKFFSIISENFFQEKSKKTFPHPVPYLDHLLCVSLVTDNIFQLFTAHPFMPTETPNSVSSFDEEVPPKLISPTSKIT